MPGLVSAPDSPPLPCLRALQTFWHPRKHRLYTRASDISPPRTSLSAPLLRTLTSAVDEPLHVVCVKQRGRVQSKRDEEQTLPPQGPDPEVSPAAHRLSGVGQIALCKKDVAFTLFRMFF